MSRDPQVADPSMLVNLGVQANAIWPQVVPLLGRYSLARNARLLDQDRRGSGLRSHCARVGDTAQWRLLQEPS